MGKFSRDKGKRAEREFAKLCQEYGFDVQRTAQCKGKTGAAGDIEGLPGIHIEVKHVERLNLREAMAQSIRDAEAEGKDKFPIVAHKKNNAEWLVTMRGRDWLQMYLDRFEYWD